MGEEVKFDELYTKLCNICLDKRDEDTAQEILRALQQADINTIFCYMPFEKLKDLFKLLILAIKQLYYQNIKLWEKIEKLEHE